MTCIVFAYRDRPDIAALRDRGAIPTSINLAPTPFQPPALEDLEAPRRQTSMDGEAIKIVIHDVDSGPICASKRRVVLRRDPTDKAHRSEYAIPVLLIESLERFGRITMHAEYSFRMVKQTN